MGSFRYSFIRDSIMTCGDLRKVKGWVVRLILRKKHRGTCLKEGFKSFKTRQPSRKFQHPI
jgi:hypothetical protein